MDRLNLITEFSHTVKSFECGPDSNLRIDHLLLLFQEAAYLSAEKLGFGFNNLQTKNMTWVISNLKIQLKKLPKWNDEIRVATWPSGYNRLLGFRDFIVEDRKGERLINAASEWLAIDVATRKPVNINDFEIELPDLGTKTINERLNRLNPRRFGEGRILAELTVPYSSIDENGHVNNAEYVKWALDGMRQHNMNIQDIKMLQISYISEIFEKGKCIINFKKDENGAKLCWGMNAGNNEYVFAIRIE